MERNVATSERLRVLFLTLGGDGEPSSRFRVLQLLPALERLGIEAAWRPLAGPRYVELGQGLRRLPAPLRAAWVGAHFALRVARRSRDLWQARRHDVLFVQKETFPFGLERLIPRLGLRVVYDFDDAVHLRSGLPDGRGPGLRRLADAILGRERALPRLLERASAVVAGNEVLAAWARRHQQRVVVVPTCVDVDAYAPAPLRRQGPLTVGWFGAPANAVYLEPLRPVFQTLARRGGFRLRLHGATRFECPGVRIECVGWKRYASVAEEVSDLHAFDVGIMPLPDTPYAAGKCALKAIQYMACGIPVVASPVGIAPQVVGEGECGFLARTPEEWLDRLARLLADPELRERLGRAGRSRVRERYALPAAASALAGVLRAARAPREADPALGSAGS
jgi:glycosyltransferase involved in cell wall biosynthesis